MDELIKELKEEAAKVDTIGWYFNDKIEEFIRLAKQSILGNNLDRLLVVQSKLVGYLFALYEMCKITNKHRDKLISLFEDICAESIFQEEV